MYTFSYIYIYVYIILTCIHVIYTYTAFGLYQLHYFIQQKRMQKYTINLTIIINAAIVTKLSNLPIKKIVDLLLNCNKRIEKNTRVNDRSDRTKQLLE